MKKVLLLLVVLAAAWIGVNYLRTGEIGLFPAAASAEGRRIHDLEKELASIDAQIAAAGRSAGMTGIDTTADVESLMKRKGQIEAEIARIRKAMR